MGGTVLDMFTLDATPLSLSYLLFFFREGDTVVPGVSPSRFPSRFLPPSILRSSSRIRLSFFLFFFFISASLVKSATQILAWRATNYAVPARAGEKL